MSNLDRKTVNILGVRIDSTQVDQVIAFVAEKINSEQRFVITTPNPEIIQLAQKDFELREIVNGSDLAIPDGVGVVWASKGEIKKRVTGSDTLTKLIAEAEEQGWKIALLGSNSAKDAASKLSDEYTKLKVASYLAPSIKEDGTSLDKTSEDKLIKDLNVFKPDIVFVGLGAPKQEKWIDRNKERINSYGFMTVGGTFDYISGKVKRAPEVIRKLGFEWLFRLLIQPWRIKRQIALISFVLNVLRSRI